jgi:hypothetical protein
MSLIIVCHVCICLSPSLFAVTIQNALLQLSVSPDFCRWCYISLRCCTFCVSVVAQWHLMNSYARPSSGMQTESGAFNNPETSAVWQWSFSDGCLRIRSITWAYLERKNVASYLLQLCTRVSEIFVLNLLVLLGSARLQFVVSGSWLRN